MKLLIMLIAINLLVLFITGVIIYKDTSVNNIRK